MPRKIIHRARHSKVFEEGTIDGYRIAAYMLYIILL